MSAERNDARDDPRPKDDNGGPSPAVAMTPKAAAPPDPARALEDALRVARAASHSRRLDSATQAALDGLVQFGRAVVDYARSKDAEIVALKKQVADLCARFFGDP